MQPPARLQSDRPAFIDAGTQVTAITTGVAIPHVTQLVTALIASVPPASATELQAALVLLHWDCEREPVAAMASLRDVPKLSPPLAELAVALAIATRSPADLRWVADRLVAASSPEQAAGEMPALRAALGATWWFVHEDVEHAAAISPDANSLAFQASWHQPQASARITTQLDALFDDLLAAQMAGRPSSDHALRNQADGGAATPERVTELLFALSLHGNPAHVVDRVLTALRAKPWQHVDPEAVAKHAARWLPMLELATDLALANRLPTRTECFELRRSLVALVGDDTDLELHDLAVALLTATQATSAPSLAALADVAKHKRSEATISAAVAVRHVYRMLAAQSGDAKTLAEAYQSLLANAAAPGINAAFARRAAQLADVSAGPDAVATLVKFNDRADALLDLPATVQASVRRLLVQAERASNADVAHLLASGGEAAQWSAYALEFRRGDLLAAMSRWQKLVDEQPSAVAQHQLARLARAVGRYAPLAETYQQLAKAQPRIWTFAAAVAYVLAGNYDACKLALTSLGPTDLLRHIGELVLAIHGQDPEQQLQAWQAISGLAIADGVKHRCMLAQASLLALQLGQPDAAWALLEKALAVKPDDAATLATMAKVATEVRSVQEAVSYQTKAVQAASPTQRPALLLELAELLHRAGNPSGSEQALAQALALAPGDLQVVAAIVDAAIATNNFARGEAALANARGAAPDDNWFALTAQLAYAKGEFEVAFAAARDSLLANPNNVDALQLAANLAARLGTWDQVSELFASATPSAANFELLAGALRQANQWEALLGLLQTKLSQALSKEEQAQLATEIATIYQTQLGDHEQAASYLSQAQQVAPNAERQASLVALLQQTGNTAALADLLVAQISALSANDTGARIGLYQQLAAVHQQAGRLSEASEAFETLVALAPGQLAPLNELEQIYATLGQPRDVVRTLHAKEPLVEPLERAALRAKIGAIKLTLGEIDAAVDNFRHAMDLDPSNRDLFTAFERVCYKHQRWEAVIALYQRCIDFVMAGNPRAYRLGDLFARLAQVQLQFLNDSDGAAENFKRAIIVESQPEAATKALESIAAKRGNFAILVEAYEDRAKASKEAERRTESLAAAAHYARLVSDQQVVMRVQRKLLAADPNNREAADTLERFYEENHDTTGLIEVIRAKLSAASSEVDVASLLTKLAKVSEEGARDVNAATAAYQQLIELQPHNRDAVDALARIYETTERWAEYVEVSKRLIELTAEPASKALLCFRIGSVMEAKFGLEDDALDYYNKAAAASDQCLPAIHGMRDIYLRRQAWPMVIQTLELELKLWREPKEQASIAAQIGRILSERMQDDASAMQYFETAIAYDADSLPANKALFDHRFAVGDFAGAKQLLASLGARAARDGDATARSAFLKKRGIVARMTGDPTDAIASLSESLQLSANDSECLEQLAMVARDYREEHSLESLYKDLDRTYRKRSDAPWLWARVMVGQATLYKNDGDLDRALATCEQALSLAPTDWWLLEAMVALHVEMRQWDHAIFTLERYTANKAVSAALRVQAWLTQAELYSEGLLDSGRAVAVLRDAIRVEPTHVEATFRLAQELLLLGKVADANIAIDRLLTLAANPLAAHSSNELARYYYYKGRIAEVAGDAKVAVAQYRRANEFDGAYAPPALMLAKRAADAGDHAQAEQLLIDAAHAAIGAGGPIAAVPLQRGLARMLMAAGDRGAAIDAYRGILSVDPTNSSDRVTLAEIYSAANTAPDLARAIGELKKVIERDIHHAPAYKLLASLYERAGEPVRAERVYSAITLLGFADAADRSSAAKLRQAVGSAPVQQALGNELRARYMVPAATKSLLTDIFTSLAEQISSLFPHNALGHKLSSIRVRDDIGITPQLQHATSLFAVFPEVFTGQQVGGLAAIVAYPRPMLVLDQSLANEEPAVRQFILGYALDAIRGGYATLLTLGRKQRKELVALMASITGPAERRSQVAIDLLSHLPDVLVAEIDQHGPAIRERDIEAWLDAMVALARRAGLVACDDYRSAIVGVARLAGETPSSVEQTTALGAVLGGADLLRFFISDEYDNLRQALVAF